MRRTRSTSRRKINLDDDDDDVRASPPNMLLISSRGARTPTRHRTPAKTSNTTPRLSSLPGTPDSCTTPNRTLNETFSPEPEEKVFSVRTLIDSVKKNKRHTASEVGESSTYGTPRVTRASVSSAIKSRTSIKKAPKESPTITNLKRFAANSPKSTARLIDAVGGSVVRVTAGDTKLIKSIRKNKRSLSVTDSSMVGEKKIVTFHSPANMEVSTYDIDVQMKSDHKVLKRLRSKSNAETENEKAKIAKLVTPEKSVKKKTPSSRKKMPNFSEIHQRQFERMESITEHAARKAERAKVLARSPMTKARSEESIFVAQRNEENIQLDAEMAPESTGAARSEPNPEVVAESIEEVASEPKPVVVSEPESQVIPNEPVENLEDEVFEDAKPLAIEDIEPLITEETEPLQMLELEPLSLEAEQIEPLPTPSSVNQNCESPILIVDSPMVVRRSVTPLIRQEPLVIDELEPPLEAEPTEPLPAPAEAEESSSIVKQNSESPILIEDSPTTLKRRASSLIGRSPFVIAKQEPVVCVPKPVVPLPPKSPAVNRKLPISCRMPSKSKLTVNKNVVQSRAATSAAIRPTKSDLNVTYAATGSTKIPLPKFNSVLTISNKNNKETTNLNASNVFVFKGNNKPPTKKPVVIPPKIIGKADATTKKQTGVVAKDKFVAPMRGPVAKENIADKVKQRQQKNISMYKGRPEGKSGGTKNAIQVRTNKRFELQMKFRQMNENN